MKLEIEKGKQSHHIGQIKNKADGHHRIDLHNAVKAFGFYEELEKTEAKIKTEYEKKNKLHDHISKFMREKLGEVMIVGDFEIYSRKEEKLASESVVFEIRKRPGTLAEKVLNEVEYLSVHLERHEKEI